MRYLLFALTLLATQACRELEPEDSQPKITNGVVLGPGEYPAIVAVGLSNLMPVHGVGCTGSFLTANLLITAAHCIETPVGDDGVGVYEANYGANLPARRVFRHPGYRDTGMNTDCREDMALIEYGSALSNDVIGISLQPGQPGDAITIVGVGSTNGKGGASDGQKRAGQNVIKSRQNGIISFDGVVYDESASGDDSASSAGDSGGPMLVNGRLVGTTCSGYVEGGRKFSYYTDLHGEYARGFFGQAIELGMQVPLPPGY